MKNIKRMLATLMGVVSIITLFVLNLSFAIDDYGIVNNKLHTQILAQSDSSGGSSSEGGGGGFSCKWGTRELSGGTWEAVCIKSGVGYDCTCGDTKQYPSGSTSNGK